MEIGRDLLWTALWLSLPSYDPVTHKAIAVAGQNVVLALPQVMRHARTHRWTADGAVVVTASSSTTATIPMTVSDVLTVIELAPPAP